MFQLGAFCPSSAPTAETPREIWEFGPFADVLVKFDKAALPAVPYIYSLAWKVPNEGYTDHARPADGFPRRQKHLRHYHQFMFGPAMMVCPVTEYMYPPAAGETTAS